MNIIHMSISATILILAFIIIRFFSINKFSQKGFIVLWCIALVRLLIPLYISLPIGVYTVADRATAFLAGARDISSIPPTSSSLAVMSGVSDASTHTNIIPVSPNVEDVSNWVFVESPEITDSISFQIPTITILWIAGVTGLFLFFVVTHLRCRREYKSASLVKNDFVLNWLQMNRIRRLIQVKQSDKINTPITYGILKPVILLPTNTDWQNISQLQYVLTHEITHIKRFDVLLKWILVIALCIHWFNPFVWVMYFLANRDIELACDETVVRFFGETSKSAYALALIGLEEKRSGFYPLCNNFAKNAIEERIRMIMKNKRKSVFNTMIITLLVSIVTIGLFTVNAQPISPQYNVNNTTFVGQLEVGTRHYMTTSNGELEFMVFIDGEYDGNDDFVRTAIHVMEVLSQMQFESSEEEFNFRQMLFSEYFSVDSDYMLIGEYLSEESIAPMATTVWVDDVWRHFWGQPLSFMPPSFTFYSRVINGRLYQGYLSRVAFTAFQSGNLWDFVVRYQGTLWSGGTFPIPFNLPVNYGEEPSSEEMKEIMQELIENSNAGFSALLAEQGITSEEWIDSFIVSLKSSNDYLSSYDGTHSTTITVSGIERFFWNQPITFRPPSFIFYSRVVNGRLYQGYISLGIFTAIPASGELWHFMGTYHGILFSGGNFPIPWMLNNYGLECPM